MNNKPQNCMIWGERKDVENFYSCMDLFLFPSRGHEGDKETNPLVLKEAVSWNIPILMHKTDSYMDKYDKNILRELQIDSRKNLSEIGAAVGLSSTPCWNRIKRLEQAGIIQNYTVNLNQDKMPLSETIIVQVSLNDHSDETVKKFGEDLERIPEVIEVFLVSGEYDYYIKIAVSGTKHYERFLREKLYKIPGIRQSRSNFVLRRIKQAKFPIDD